MLNDREVSKPGGSRVLLVVKLKTSQRRKNIAILPEQREIEAVFNLRKLVTGLTQFVTDSKVYRK